MITIKELKKHYNVLKHDKDTYLIHELKVGNSRMVHKYLCTVHRMQGRYWNVVGSTSGATAKLDKLKDNIQKYVDSLEYDSEYYYPRYRDGIFEELIIHDYLDNLGFDHSGGYSHLEGYTLNKKNIYGKKIDLNLTFDGLSGLSFRSDNIPQYVTISYDVDYGSWVSVKVERNVDDIKKGIDSILKPLFLTESAENILSADKLESNEQLDVIFNKLVGFSKSETSGKEELKKRLLELANSL